MSKNNQNFSFFLSSLFLSASLFSSLFFSSLLFTHTDWTVLTPICACMSLSLSFLNFFFGTNTFLLLLLLLELDQLLLFFFSTMRILIMQITISEVIRAPVFKANHAIWKWSATVSLTRCQLIENEREKCSVSFVLIERFYSSMQEGEEGEKIWFKSS